MEEGWKGDEVGTEGQEGQEEEEDGGGGGERAKAGAASVTVQTDGVLGSSHHL